jgi:hypothetical protein
MVQLDPDAHVFFAFKFVLKSGCDREGWDQDARRLATLLPSRKEQPPWLQS